MSLGVLNNLSAIYAENNLNNTSNSLQTVLQQLSSGSKINSGADDAAGLSLVNGLEANSTALAQSETNSTEGVGLLQVADGALSQVTNLLDRAITLATEASNGTLNTSQEAAANQEYSSIMSEINNIGSTTTYNQQQVFTGDKVSIFTGDSSSQGSSIDQLNIHTLSSATVGDTGGEMSYSSGQSNVFINLSTATQNAAVSDSLGAATATTSIAVQYLSQGAGGAAITASATISCGAGTSYANTAQGLINAINGAGLGLNATFSTTANAGSAAIASALGSSTATGILISGQSVGAGTNEGVVGTLTTTNAGDDLGGTLNIGSSQISLGTANSTDTLAHLASYINAGAYGVTATVNAGDTALTLSSANSTLVVTGTALADTTLPVTNTLTLSNVPTPIANMATQAGTIGTLSTAAAANTFTGALTFTGGTGVLETVNMGAGKTLAQIEQAINLLTGTTGVSATINGANTAMTLSSTNADSVANITMGDLSGLTDSGAETLTGTVTPPVAYYASGISGTVGDTSTGGGTTVTALTTDTNGTTATATIGYSDGAGEDLSGTDLLSQTNAQTALTALSSAITDVAAMDGYIGAQINTLNSVSQVMNTQQENVTSAQNAVQATDYAAATAAMSKYEILSQTGIAALAQANTVQQEVTKLLQ